MAMEQLNFRRIIKYHAYQFSAMRECSMFNAMP